MVNNIRRIFGERSVGHLGTLDPLATGVLPLLAGPATRLAKFHGDAQKTYEASVRFGFATDTYDAEGVRTTDIVPVDLDRDQLEAALDGFRGVIRQIPPSFSAKKVSGVPAYKLARQNKPVELKAVEIEIFAIDVLDVSGDEATLRVHCGTGTYVRSLAHDLGAALGCGAHLSALRRTRSGEYGIEQAYTIEELERRKIDGRLLDTMLPASQLLPHFPTIVIDETTEAHIRMGRNFHTSPFRTPSGAPLIKAVTESGALLAIAEAVLPNLYHPVVVMP